MSQDLEMTKNGITVSVRVNTVFGGRFETKVGEQDLHAPTWTELEKLVDRATKRVAKSVSVPFTRVTAQHTANGTTVKGRHGVATGLHSANGNVLVKVDGQSLQISGYERRDGEFYTVLTGADLTEYGDLLRALRNAESAVRTWRQSHAIDLKAEVIAELNEGAAPTS